MPNCKICGAALRSGKVVHTDCWEQVIAAVKAFCVTNCVNLYKCSNNRDLTQKMYCRDCAVYKLVSAAGD